MNLKLYMVPQTQIDFAWRDGADCLKDACQDECTIDQLKMILSRGERHLVRMDEWEDDKARTVGWGCFRVDNYPAYRVLHVTNLVARHCHFERFFELLKQAAYDLGCSRIRCSAKEAQSRIYQRKLGFQPVYTTLEVVL